MPLSRIVFLSLLVLFVGMGDARAESYPITIKSVRFGLPSGPFVKDRDEDNQPLPLFKAGVWAPIEIKLDFDVAAPLADREIEVIAGVPDGDDVISEVRQRIDAPPTGRAAGVRLSRDFYLKPGGPVTEITVQVKSVTTGQALAAPYRRKLNGLSPSQYLILSCGSSLSSLRLPAAEGQAAQGDSLRNGWVQLAVAHHEDLPERWFGYEAVDLLILTEQFMREAQNNPSRVQAIAEWVRRGGRLLICGVSSPDRFRDMEDMFPARVNRAAQRSLAELAMVLPNSPRLLLKAAEGQRIPVLSIAPKPERPYQTKLLADERDNPFPLIVQAPYGLGRVTLVTFDLDRAPFDDWQHREAFWEYLLNLAGTRLPSGSEPLSAVAHGDDEDKYLTRLQNNLEFFEGVPVVSFGWVALLILLYILLIGPVEYLLLKKLLKRMELTWVTFPIIVAGTCAAAYFAALDLKGRDLKTNKIDLVEIDVDGQRAYGQTWFTIFSPRIQNFTIGVEPLLAPAAPQDVLVSWHGQAKNARQSLFRRSYTYHTSTDPDAYADGLEHVPIQVWSTKSFTAQWSATMRRPLIESTLHIAPADATQLTGSITSHLPGAVITDAQLIYRDRVTPAPPLLPGVPRYVWTSPQALGATPWLHNQIPQKDLISSNRAGRAGPSGVDPGPQFRLWPMLFHDIVQGQFGRLFNSSVRELDQSWRVSEKNPHQAILVARLRCAEGPAEEMSNAPGAPTRLWFNDIPGRGPRQPIEGTLRQETFLRVYIPILPAKP